MGHTRSEVMSDTKDSYPDLYLPVVENYKISDKFYGYSDSLSADNNPIVLVELKGLSYQYGMSIYAVDPQELGLDIYSQNDHTLYI